MHQLRGGYIYSRLSINSTTRNKAIENDKKFTD